MVQPVLQSSAPLAVGVDVGGTKVAASLVDLHGQIHASIRRPTDVSSPQATLDCIAQTVRELIQLGGIGCEVVYGVGLGIPGLVDAERGIGIASVNLGWENVPVKSELEARLHLPCALENDVKAATLGEARYGAGRGKQHLVYVSIGTGIAAGILLQGRLYSGLNGMAGEIGHAVVDRNGRLCKCGARGCLEAVAAGPAIAARAVEKIESGRASLLADLLEKEGHEITAASVFQAAAQGDEIAVETLSETGAYLAFALQFLALAYDPEVLILGGGVAQGGDFLLEPIRQNLARQAADSWVLGKIYNPEFIQLTALGNEIGVLGAAALVAPDTLRERIHPTQN